MDRIRQTINSILDSRHDSTKRWIRSLEERAENSGAPQYLIDAIHHYRTELVTIEQIMADFQDEKDRLEAAFRLDADDL